MYTNPIEEKAKKCHLVMEILCLDAGKNLVAAIGTNTVAKGWKSCWGNGKKYRQVKSLENKKLVSEREEDPAENFYTYIVSESFTVIFGFTLRS